MDQAPKDGGLGAQASFDSLNGDSDDDAFSEVTGISRRSVSGWGSFANLQGAERNVSRFFRRFIPSHTTAQTGKGCCWSQKARSRCLHLGKAAISGCCSANPLDIDSEHISIVTLSYQGHRLGGIGRHKTAQTWASFTELSAYSMSASWHSKPG